METALTLGVRGYSGIKGSWRFCLDTFKTAMDKLAKSMEHGRAPIEMDGVWSAMLSKSAEKVEARSYQKIDYSNQGARWAHMLVGGIFASDSFQELLNADVPLEQVNFCNAHFMGHALARELQAQRCSDEMKRSLLENEHFLRNGAMLFLRAVDPQAWSQYYQTVTTMGDLFSELALELTELVEKLNVYLQTGVLSIATCEEVMRLLSRGISREALEEKYEKHPCIELFLQFVDHFSKAGDHRATYLLNMNLAPPLFNNFLDTRS